METITLELPESQLIEWVQKLSPTAKQAVLKSLIPGLEELNEIVAYGSQRMREICARRGLDWDTLTEDERRRLVDQMLHEK